MMNIIETRSKRAVLRSSRVVKGAILTPQYLKRARFDRLWLHCGFVCQITCHGCMDLGREPSLPGDTRMMNITERRSKRALLRCWRVVKGAILTPQYLKRARLARLSPHRGLVCQRPCHGCYGARPCAVPTMLHQTDESHRYLFTN